MHGSVRGERNGVMAKRMTGAIAFAASVALAAGVCVAPASALEDVALGGATGATTGMTSDASASASAGSRTSGSGLSAFAAQPVAASDATAADAMPDNPDAALPDKVASDIADDDTVVSESHALTDDGELKDIQTGETVTDPQLVGTSGEQPDPLAKTDGASFIPVDAAEVKDKVAANGGDVEGDASASGESDGASDSSDKSDDAASDQSASVAPTRASDTARVTTAALQNNEYGAYWGSYNGTPAFFSKGGTLFVQQAKGVVDVSEWQGDIDWQKAKNAGVEGAIIRIGYGWGNGLDKKAQRNINECKRLGIPFGVYLYSYAYDASTGAKEGANVANLLKQAGVNPGDMSYPVYYDLEAWSWTGHAHPTNPSVYEGIVNAWYTQMRNAGYTNLSVYSYTSYLANELNSSSIHAKTRWVAQYGARMQYTAWPSNDRGWQYTSSGTINGISGKVDLNAFGYKTYQAATDVRTLDAIAVPNGTYYINSAKKNSAGVEIAGGNTANGVKTQLYDANRTKAQQFTFTKQSDGSYVIKNVGAGRVLDVSGGNAGNNATVQQYDANGSAAQRWFIRDSGAGWYLQSALGNWVLDIAGGNTANGTTVALYEPNGSDAQKFSLASVSASTRVPTGTSVRLRSVKNTTYVIDMTGASTTNNAKTQLYAWNGSAAQIYRFKEIGNGVYEIANANSGKTLETAGGRTGNSVAIQQYTSNGTAAQRWSVVDVDGKLTFLSAKSAKAVDIPGGTVISQAKLQTYTYNGTVAQQWLLDKQQTPRERLDAAAAANKGALADGTYKVASAAKASRVLDVSGGSTANYANVQLYADNATDAQRWVVSHDAKGYVTLKNAKSGKVLDVSGGSTASGANVQQFASNGTWAQKWIAVRNGDGTVTLRSAAVDGIVLDVAGGSTANGANVQQYASNGTKAQRWTFTVAKTLRGRLDESAAKNRSALADGATYVFAAKAKTSRALDVSGGSAANYANVQIYASNGTAAQKWRVSHDAKGYVTLKNVKSGKVLDVSGGSTSNGANIQQFASNGTWAQKWIVVRNANGSVTLRSAAAENMVVDIAGGSTASGANVQLYAANGTAAQQWVAQRK
ncbi:RICIN domain-containing protein [Bifidobacterium sp. CP2]|nr:RICIN domain-containing protein [Bifidobacterium sp. CP2]